MLTFRDREWNRKWDQSLVPILVPFIFGPDHFVPLQFYFFGPGPGLGPMAWLLKLSNLSHWYTITLFHGVIAIQI